jgi:hypothetical protein
VPRNHAENQMVLLVFTKDTQIGTYPSKSLTEQFCYWSGSAGPSFSTSNGPYVVVIGLIVVVDVAIVEVHVPRVVRIVRR